MDPSPAKATDLQASLGMVAQSFIAVGEPSETDRETPDLSAPLSSDPVPTPQMGPRREEAYTQTSDLELLADERYHEAMQALADELVGMSLESADEHQIQIEQVHCRVWRHDSDPDETRLQAAAVGPQLEIRPTSPTHTGSVPVWLTVGEFSRCRTSYKVRLDTALKMSELKHGVGTVV